mmetsp:Transcript_4486/g.5195  ORF Transcript_4486/g.5195 Transcript_4486/m.5195 type:complete len:171 (+) Transcript_4486:85-597(+)
MDVDTTTKTKSASSSNNIEEEEVDLIEHGRFIACLEKYGEELGFEAATGIWEKISKDLCWSTQKAEQYGYNYFVTLLLADNTQPSSLSIINNNTDYKNWTEEETILFETLLLEHKIEDEETDNSGRSSTKLWPSWVQKIAESFSNKTEEDILKKYESEYLQSNNKKQKLS